MAGLVVAVPDDFAVVLLPDAFAVVLLAEDFTVVDGPVDADLVVVAVVDPFDEPHAPRAIVAMMRGAR
jgi:hypothetical protein